MKRRNPAIIAGNPRDDFGGADEQRRELYRAWLLDPENQSVLLKYMALTTNLNIELPSTQKDIYDFSAHNPNSTEIYVETLIEFINSHECGRSTLFGDYFYVRINAAPYKDKIEFWLMSRPEGGWGAFGIPHHSLLQLREKHPIRLHELSSDEHSEYWLFVRDFG